MRGNRFLNSLIKRAHKLARMFGGWRVCLCKKRGAMVGKTKRGKGTKIMVLSDGHGVPMAALTESASVHEVKLIEQTMDQVRVPRSWSTEDASEEVDL